MEKKTPRPTIVDLCSSWFIKKVHDCLVNYWICALPVKFLYPLLDLLLNNKIKRKPTVNNVKYFLGVMWVTKVTQDTLTSK